MLMHEHNGCRGAGFTIRDNDGRMFLQRNLPLGVLPLAEVIGTWSGHHRALTVLGATHLRLEGEMISVVQAIKTWSKVHGMAANLLMYVTGYVNLLITKPPT